MSESISSRKLEHVRAILDDAATDRQGMYFDRVRLMHRALPERDLRDVDPATTFLDKRLSFPLLISSMTGGDHETLEAINRNLALAAEKAQVALGVGSQRIMFERPAARASFTLRRHAPTTVLLANLGAVQLNEGFDAATCQAAIDAVGADGLCLHLNPLQECVQAGGDTNFNGLADKIGETARAVNRPVIVKEVGAGLSAEDAHLLVDRGIRYLDVAGSGGTSWSRIEGLRQPASQARSLGELFQDWGIPTPVALMALRPFRRQATLIASGGIRNGLDMAKAVILGASLCGVARPLLEPAMESVEAVTDAIERLRREFVTAMFLLGVGRFDDLLGNEALLLQSGLEGA